MQVWNQIKCIHKIISASSFPFKTFITFTTNDSDILKGIYLE